MKNEKCGACVAKTLMEMVDYRDSLNQKLDKTKEEYGEDSIQYISTLSEWGGVTTCLDALKRQISEM